MTDALRQHLCGGLNGAQNVNVPRAAAQVVREGWLDFFLCGVRVGVQQGFGREDDPRGTESALHRDILMKAACNGCSKPSFDNPSMVSTVPGWRVPA